MTQTVLGGLAVLFFAITLAVAAVDPDLAFFGTPFRFHQFLIGSVFALLADARSGLVPGPRITGPIAGAAGVAAGGALIVLAVPEWLPGLEQTWVQTTASLAAAATCWLCSIGERAGNTSLLGVRALTFLGTRSYAIYLAHWPVALVAVALAGAPEDQTLMVKLLVLAGGIAAGLVLAETVERPMRYLGRTDGWGYRPRLAVTGGLAGAAVAGGIAGLVLIAPGTGSGRLGANPIPTLGALRAAKSGAVPEGRCAIKFSKDMAGIDVRPCLSTRGEANILVIGDSLSSGVAVGLMRRFPTVNFIRVFRAGCPPFFSDDQETITRMQEKLRGCTRPGGFLWHVVEGELRKMPQSEIDGLILAGNWNAARFKFTGAFHVADGLVGLPYPIAVAGVRVHLKDEALRLFEAGRIGPDINNDARACLPVKGYAHRQLELNRRMADRINDLPGVSYIDVHGAMCGAACPLFVGDALIYQDQVHLTLEGADYLAATGVFDAFVHAIDPDARPVTPEPLR